MFVISSLLLVVLRVSSAQNCVTDSKFIRGGLSCSEAQAILDQHNLHRNNVAGGGAPSQPPASNMLELIWDVKLANAAQDWANRCEFTHGGTQLDNGETVGQNIALMWTTGEHLCNSANHIKMVNNWFDEVNMYKFSSDFSIEAGHYTQMVWGKTTKLGCGTSVYSKGRNTYCFLVCNYSPPGNWVGETPYEPGRRSCQKYNWFNSISYNNLCAIDNHIRKACY